MSQRSVVLISLDTLSSVPVVSKQVLGHEHHQLPPHGFIPVHLGHPLQHWLAHLPGLVCPTGDLQHQQLLPLHGLPDGVDLGQAGVGGLVLLENGLETS